LRSYHTVHLPVLHRGQTVARTYEAGTYPVGVRAYRTGTTPDGALPLGAGAKAQSCQDCHAEAGCVRHSFRARSRPSRSKQLPQAEYTAAGGHRSAVREGYTRHTLVGLNLFLIKMAQQFRNCSASAPKTRC
jgi:hypothetical protein